MVAGQHFACAANTALHLVGHEEHVVLLADVVALLQVAFIGDVNASLALDGFQQETGDFVAFLLKHFLKSIGVVVGDADEAGSHGAVVGVALGVIAHGDDGDGTAMEVAFAAHDFHLVVRDTFFDDTPTAGELEARFVGFRARVHGQHLVVAEVFSHVFFPHAERVVIEGAAAEGEAFGLVGHGLQDFRVAVALVHGGIGRQEVEIFLAFHVPHFGALTFGEDDWQRVIVMGSVLGFEVHSFLR